MEKEWMNAPLPPLSQSIIASGLVVGDYSIAKVPSSTKKKQRSLSTINMPPKKSIPKIMSQRPNKDNPNDSDLLTDKESIDHPSAKTSRPINMNSSSSCSPTRKKTTQTKAPIEQYHIYTKEERDQIYQHEHQQKIPEKINIDYISNSSRLKSDRPIGSETFRRNFKEETNEIINELDKNISSSYPNIENIDINTLPIEKQTDLKSKLLQFYNFSFNKIILQERSMCTERALLMRRFQNFYNQLFRDIPLLMTNINNYKTEHSQKYESLLKKTKEIESNTINITTENQDLKNQVASLTKQIESLTDSSNQKDIQMSSKVFDLDLAKCQAAQYQFKIHEKKDKIKALKNTIEKLEETNKNQLVQIENLTKTINKLKQGDASYLSMYRNALEKNEQLESKIKKLEEEKIQLNSIQKVEIEIQTDPEKQDVSPQIISPMKNKKERRCSQTAAQSLLPPKPTKKGRRGSSSALTKTPLLGPNSSSQFNKTEGQFIDHSQVNQTEPTAKSFSKTQPIAISQTKIPSLSPQKPPDQPPQNTPLTSQPPPTVPETVEQKILVTIETQTEDDIKIQSQSSSTQIQQPPKNDEKKKEKKEKYSNFKLPDGYSVNHSILDNLPDMFSIITPSMSRSCASPCEHELEFINSTAYPQNYKSDKPLFWAIQLVHSFLIDSFVRSVQNENYATLEAIFVEWITARYSLPHLVQQIICDFSYILLHNSQKVPYLSLFIEILIGPYSFSQLCFLSTIYTFSFELTFPTVDSLLQSDSDPDLIEKPMIHLECVEKVVANIFFSNEIAEQFISDEFYESCSKTNCVMINYVDFLLKSTILFGKEHSKLHTKTKNLLLLCGCFDPMGINYECFVKFFAILGFTFSSQIKTVGFFLDSKSEWKRVVKKKRVESNQHDKLVENCLLKLSELLSVCVEKKKPLVNLIEIEIESLNGSINRIKNLSSLVLEFYYDLLSRFANLLPKIFDKLSSKINKKIESYYEKLRVAMLRADVGAIIYAYRLILNKIDRLVMKEKGFIPFNANCNSDVISKLVEYVDRTESVSFALIET